MWIDTHCHLDAAEFGDQADAIVAQAAQAGVACIVIPAIERANFATVTGLAQRVPHCVYALGIHPIYVPQADEADLAALRTMIPAALGDSHFVAIGEIGLDFFVPELTSPALREKQEFFYVEQLRIARDFGLPVLLHIRRAQDVILKYLRRIEVKGGIAHAFNGSMQQARSFVDLGFKLGFGGAMTFPRALQIRRLASELPLEALVLETDAPDIPPIWLHRQINKPEQIPRIGELLAELRATAADVIRQATGANARAILPRLPD